MVLTELVREITDWLWGFTDVRKVVNNNYIILQSIVRNVVKDLGINDTNFDLQAFMDNFDIYELDPQPIRYFPNQLSQYHLPTPQ